MPNFFVSHIADLKSEYSWEQLAMPATRNKFHSLIVAISPKAKYIFHEAVVLIQEEIKCRLKLGNACYYSVQNLLSSSLLSKTLKFKIDRTIILPGVLYGCETWSLTLREERRLRVFENRVLRRVFGPKRDEVTGNGENYIMRNLGIFTPYPILCGW